MFHPSMKKPEVPLIRRGVCEAAVMLVMLGVVFLVGALYADRFLGICAAVAFFGAILLLTLEIYTWFKEEPSKGMNDEQA